MAIAMAVMSVITAFAGAIHGVGEAFSPEVAPVMLGALSFIAFLGIAMIAVERRVR